MHSRDEPFLRSFECYFGIYFPRCFATREINTKITLSWALKRFVTRVHTLFSIYLCWCWDRQLMLLSLCLYTMRNLHSISVFYQWVLILYILRIVIKMSSLCLVSMAFIIWFYSQMSETECTANIHLVVFICTTDICTNILSISVLMISHYVNKMKRFRGLQIPFGPTTWRCIV